MSLKVHRHGSRFRPRVALTFDDGPNEPYTSRVLDILRSHRALATFFVVGENCLRYPATAHRIADEGHALGNHTFSHIWWHCLTHPALARRELRMAQQAVADASGVRPALFRPPHGFYVPWLVAAAGSLGMECVLWDVSTADWQVTREWRRIVTAVAPRIRPGSIVLLHDGRETRHGYDRTQMLRALPSLLDAIADRGLELVSVSELLGLGATLP